MAESDAGYRAEEAADQEVAGHHQGKGGCADDGGGGAAALDGVKQYQEWRYEIAGAQHEDKM